MFKNKRLLVGLGVLALLIVIFLLTMIGGCDRSRIGGGVVAVDRQTLIQYWESKDIFDKLVAIRAKLDNYWEARNVYLIHQNKNDPRMWQGNVIEGYDALNKPYEEYVTTYFGLAKEYNEKVKGLNDSMKSQNSSRLPCNVASALPYRVDDCYDPARSLPSVGWYYFLN